MISQIYIESADEITTVIERLRGAPEKQVALVAPRGATLLQSVVNLKLARRAADDAGKEIIVVTTDKIGQNLCSQLGIATAKTEEEAAKVLRGDIPASGAADDVKVIAGVRIHNYYDEEKDGPGDGTAPDPILIPKQLLKDEAVETAQPAIAVPAGTPEPPAESEVVAPTPETKPEPAPALTRTQFERNETPATVETIAAHTGAKKDKKEKEKRPKEPTTPNQKKVIKLSLYLAGVGLLTILTLAFLFLPFTRVELTVQATSWSKELAFSASTDLTNPSSDSTALPAEAITVTSDKTITFQATGSKEVGDKATGTVTFSNSSTTNTLTVPSGTTITAGGKTFVTTADGKVDGLTISGGKITPGSGQAPITATESGPASNMSNTLGDSVTVGKDSVSTVVNSSGGTSKTVTIVTSDDINKAKTDLTTGLTADAAQKMSDQLANREVTYKSDADVTELGDVTTTVNVGDQVSTGDITGSITLHRTIVNTPTLEGAITDRLRGDQLTNHTYLVSTKDVKVTSVSSDGKILALTVDLTGKESPVIPTDDLANQLNGKSLVNGLDLISKTVGATDVTVTQSPKWWPIKRYPSISRYILIDVKYE